MKFYKKTKKIIFIFIFIFILIIFFANISVFLVSVDKIYHNIDSVPNKKMALVLGTSKYTTGGEYNYFYKMRLKAAHDLIKNNKVELLLLSGTEDGAYNEPRQMKKDLIKMGILEEQIILDTSGYRTLDSVIRAKKVFGYDDFIIVSQSFHIQRSLFIAYMSDMDKIIGYAALTPPLHFSWKVYIRELFARVKLFYDIVFKIEPKSLEKF